MDKDRTRGIRRHYTAKYRYRRRDNVKPTNWYRHEMTDFEYLQHLKVEVELHGRRYEE